LILLPIVEFDFDINSEVSGAVVVLYHVFLLEKKKKNQWQRGYSLLLPVTTGRININDF